MMLLPSSLVDEVTISIVSHGHGPLLVRLLSDLNRQTDLSGVKVILTLNVSEDVDAAVFGNLQIQVLQNFAPKGFGSNHNAAFARCSTKWFLILNPDLGVHTPDTFSRLALSAAAIDRIGVVAPRIQSSSGATEDSVRSNLTPWSLVRRRLGDRRIIDFQAASVLGQPFYWLAGMCMMLDSDAFRSIGGFDDRIFLYCEDYDLCARLYNTGYVLAVDQNVSVTHDAQRDSHRSSRHLRWHLASLFRIWTSSTFWRVTLPASRP
ncbi:hypothetical protein GCM10011529_15140 [Polymorphobacter glacialis]|uniref:Glycosyltransferase 2-like domain-containing protein n=1 Tax=Sandarakinorhabdus glacialis TaxID=1614636 RepID=A0A916ZRV7_9SPHN|nr:glycosyltransferase [Polymorphobacter glacialis]GGE09760.1 hypothetical protein GCM10011529_15140 [Polymorphobacter glacialis]